MEALYCHIPSSTTDDIFRPGPGDLIFDLGEWIIDTSHNNYTELHQVEVHAIAKAAQELVPYRTWRLTAVNRRDAPLNVTSREARSERRLL